MASGSKLIPITPAIRAPFTKSLSAKNAMPSRTAKTIATTIPNAYCPTFAKRTTLHL